ncbi:restriction endonuclease subunit S [Paraprevotella clara]|uniref:restriction endonuclease subunit S n=1 Tax=Paraprevotella clara TaxID=454154 RepID=UPI00248C8171|nr:restriction endonuclease subunit S [Paraprevotella clara]
MADNKDKKVLKVPDLRFPEFTDEWERKKFRDVCNITTGNKNTQDKSNDGIYPFYVRSQIVERINSWTFDGEAILTAGDGVGVGKVFHYSTGKIGVHQRVYILSDFKCDGKYLYSYFAGHFYNRVKRMSAKNSVDSVRMEMIADMPISLPSTEEQKKIGHLLALLDERIATQTKIIEDLKKLKSAIIEKLYSEIQGKEYSFGQLFEVVNERNKQMEYSNILSASQEKGMVNRDDLNLDIQFERSNINTYKIVMAGDYVIHLRSFQGGFAFADKLGVCSPAYTILRPNSLLEYGYLSYYFTSNRFIKSLIIVTYGIRDGRSINVEEWLNMKIAIPSKGQQFHILKVLKSIDDKIENEEIYATCLSNQKQYLLRQMFI